ncbi:MAG: hypothetical protein ACREIV_10525, partial [Planctomycetaceae bacterium]
SAPPLVDADPPVAVTIPQPPVVDPAAEERPAEPPAENGAVTPQVQYVSADGVLLRYDPQGQDWFVLPPRALVQPGDTLASPVPFDALLRAEDQDLDAELLGGTSARLLPAQGQTPFGVGLRRGRLVFRRTMDPPADGIVLELPLSLGLRGETCRLDLLTHDAVLAVEIVLNEPFQFEQPLGANLYEGGLYVAAGSARFTDSMGRSVTLSAGEDMSLSPADRAAGQELVAAPIEPPEWINPETRHTSAALRRYALVYENRFSSEAGMSLLVPAIVKDPNPQYSEWATRCLALLEDHANLVKVLAEVKHEEAVEAAIHGLRSWLPTAPDNGKLLKADLARFFPADYVDDLYRLLWGFDVTDGRNEFTSNELVDWLDHEHLAVRELAFEHVYRLAGQTYGYHPMLRSNQRRSAIERWKEHIEENGGLVPQ